MAIEIFNRYEHKYKLDTKTFNKVLEIYYKEIRRQTHDGFYFRRNDRTV